MKTARRLLLGLGAALTPAFLVAQGIPLGSELPVNTYTTGRQTNPVVSSAGDGSFVVIWARGPANPGIFGRRYDGQGAPEGPEFQVNSGTTVPGQYSSVAANASGGFVVFWGDADLQNSHGQRFDPSGAPIGPENFLARTDPQVASDAAGDFVVACTNSRYTFIGNFKIGDLEGRHLDASGTPIGGEFNITSATASYINDIVWDFPTSRAVTMSSGGDFVVVWGDGEVEYPQGARPTANPGRGVFGQRFDKNHSKLGPAFRVTAGDSYPDAPGIAMDPKGNFVVVWSTLYAPDDAKGIRGQRFDSSGAKVGPEFQVNTYTTGVQTAPSVAVDERGDFLVVWASDAQDGSATGVFGALFDRHGNRRGDEFQLNTFTSGAQNQPRVANDGRGFVVAWQSADEDASGLGIIGRRQNLRAETLTVDAATAPGTSSDKNGVLEPGETVLVVPKWSNTTADPISLTGTASSPLCAIGDPCVTTVDQAAAYGTIPPDGVVDCGQGAPDCYQVSATGPRPGTHWDGRFFENLSAGGAELWTMHVGDSFTDVPRSQPFYRKIETLLHHGITSGCTATTYCPGTTVTRDAMAIFIAKALAGGAELVPSAGTIGSSAYACSGSGASIFTDVAPTDSFCRHVHYLANRNVLVGCDATRYCPGQTITRDTMAAFIARALVAPGGGGAVPLTYSDLGTGLAYSCATASPNVHFTDVPVSNAFCKHIHYLWAKGVVDGCSATKYCPSAPVARDAMAKFIGNGFGLKLYGP